MKNIYSTLLSISILILVVLGCAAPPEQNKESSKSEKQEVNETVKPTPNIEFALELSDKEKQKNTEIIVKLPEYQKVKKTLDKIGFTIEKFDVSAGARENPLKGELTGLIFNGEAKQTIDGKDYKILLMGPTKDRVEDLRLQSYGEYSNARRKQLIDWTSELLKNLDMEEIPNEFVTKMLSGKNVSGDSPIHNDCCSFSVLQKPWEQPNADPKRISLDLSFHIKKKKQ